MDDGKRPEDGNTPEEELLRTIEKQTRQKIRSREEGREILFGLGLFGIVGWSIAIPTLIGVFAGVLLDRRFDMGFSWTLTLLFVGVVVGCLNAWRWIRDKSGGDR